MTDPRKPTDGRDPIDVAEQWVKIALQGHPWESRDSDGAEPCFVERGTDRDGDGQRFIESSLTYLDACIIEELIEVARSALDALEAANKERDLALDSNNATSEALLTEEDAHDATKAERDRLAEALREIASGKEAFPYSEEENAGGYEHLRRRSRRNIIGFARSALAGGGHEEPACPGCGMTSQVAPSRSKPGRWMCHGCAQPFDAPLVGQAAQEGSVNDESTQEYAPLADPLLAEQVAIPPQLARVVEVLREIESYGRSVMGDDDHVAIPCGLIVDASEALAVVLGEQSDE